MQSQQATSPRVVGCRRKLLHHGTIRTKDMPTFATTGDTKTYPKDVAASESNCYEDFAGEKSFLYKSMEAIIELDDMFNMYRKGRGLSEPISRSRGVSLMPWWRKSPRS
jgi:hypothetical protein